MNSLRLIVGLLSLLLTLVSSFGGTIVQFRTSLGDLEHSRGYGYFLDGGQSGWVRLQP